MAAMQLKPAFLALSLTNIFWSLSLSSFLPISMLSPSKISVFLIIYVPSRYSLLCLRSGLHPMSSCILAFKLLILRFRFMLTQCSFFHPLMFICIISWSCLIPICLVASSSSVFSCPIYFISCVLFYVVIQCVSELLICYMMSLYNCGCRVFLLKDIQRWSSLSLFIQQFYCSLSRICLTGSH